MQKPIVCIQTELGNIRLQLETEKANLTAQNFLGYITRGDFTNSYFYRVVHQKNQDHQAIKIAVIQGGLGMNSHPKKGATIAHQTTLETGIKHLNGTISMSRLEPGSAHSEFFICIGDQPELDYGGQRNPDGQGFAAFGQTIEGFEIILEIQQQPEQNQMLLEPIKIHSITLENQ
jgi:peptidyl-prolyl cis-trans isomerase A (cyclophilin A)